MRRRVAFLVLAVVSAVAATGAQAQLPTHPAAGRVDITDVGDPILINRHVLALEMKRNSDLRAWVNLYGTPDYAEVQQIQIDPPFAPYEVRLYYLNGDAYLAFGRVHVAPSLYDYGVRKFYGPILPSELDRLLTAQPVTPSEVKVTESGAMESAPPSMIVETVAVEGVPVVEQ